MPRACLVLLALAATSCTLVEWDRTAPADRIVLVNRSGEPVYFAAIELQASHRVDPIPSFDPAESPLPRVDAGASAVVTDIDAYRPGDDVRFFLYALRGEAARAVLVEILTVTDEELRAAAGRVTVGAL